ncbi:sporulation protein YqfC [Marininema mesophilum]|uniref:Sporulation protein YqfC n=1 Tax=Marininema mesophilum TaxID=1048340 RepID=A0A1H2R6B3_9BACL|nr:sporulation protein YqfC [Marininema mesophilum]SDW14394.1 sporulation protein YqfC [Marininema mesophilum]
MRKIGSRVRKFASDLLDIPQDVMTDVPRILIIGPYRVHVENHHGVEKFSDGEIRLRTARGVLQIIGAQLKIQAIYSHDIWIDGTVSEVKYLD